jgi:hypothetical protein
MENSHGLLSLQAKLAPELHQALNLWHPSIHTHKVSYRKDKSSAQQKPMQALIMLKANLSKAKRQSQNPATEQVQC